MNDAVFMINDGKATVSVVDGKVVVPLMVPQVAATLVAGLAGQAQASVTSAAASEAAALVSKNAAATSATAAASSAATAASTASPISLTRAAIASAATGGTIVAGRLYLISDEARLAIGLTATSYQAYAKQGEGGTGGEAEAPAPVNTVLPTITGTAQEGQTLTGSLGTWTGSPTLARKWKRNSTAISGATGATYVPVLVDVGNTITHEVTGTVSGKTPVVANSAPTATVIAAASGGSTTLNTALPIPMLAYTGNDVNGEPLVTYYRTSDMFSTDSIELIRAVLPDLVGATYETQPLSGGVEENSELSFASLNTTGYYVWQARLVRGSNHGLSGNYVTNDQRTPVITGSGTEASPTTTSAVEPTTFGPVFTANKPLLWTLLGADAGLYTVPASYTATFYLTDVVTDYETNPAIDIGVSGVDITGAPSNEVWVRRTVTNDPADDPVIPMAWDATSSGKRISTILTNNNKTANAVASDAMIRSSNPLTVTKGYFEVHYDTKTDNIHVGLIQDAYANYELGPNWLTGEMMGFLAQSGYADMRGPTQSGQNITGDFGTNGGQGAVYQVAYDLNPGVRKMWPGVNNDYSGDPVAQTGGFTIPTGLLRALGVAINGDDFTLRPTATDQTYAAPSGYTAIA